MGSEDGTINWDSVSTGWNTACGIAPGTWAQTAAIYREDTGGRSLLTSDSGFKQNAWTGGNFKVFKVTNMEQVDGFPFGTRVQQLHTIVKLFQMNQFFLPTAVIEIIGWFPLEYEVCAYFENRNGVPDMRLIKPTKTALGSGNFRSFVQHFIAEKPDMLYQYDAVSRTFNDDDNGVGKARFSTQAGVCGIWSEAQGAMPIVALIVVLSLLLFGYICLLIFLCLWRRRSKKSSDAQ